MKKFFKVLFLIVVGILVIIGAITTCTGYALKKGIQGMAEQAVDAGPQESVVMGTELVVKKSKKHLNTKSVYVLKGFEVCKATAQPDYDFSYSVFCVEGGCSSILESKTKPLVGSLTLNRKYQGVCRSQTIPHMENYRVLKYSSEIGIDKLTAQKLQIVDLNAAEVQRTPHSKFHTNSSVRVMSDSKVTLEYEGLPPSSDEFLFGGKLIKVNYVP